MKILKFQVRTSAAQYVALYGTDLSLRFAAFPLFKHKGPWALSPEGRGPELEANRLPPCSGEVKNAGAIYHHPYISWRGT
jgi:hypothetical protein